MLNIPGHRLGTAEIESAMVAHPQVAEAAVVGCPHEIKRQGIYVFVTLVLSAQPSDELRAELRAWVRREIGPIGTLGPELAQDALRHPAQDRGQRTRATRRHLHTRRRKRGGESHQGAYEPVKRCSPGPSDQRPLDANARMTWAMLET